MQVVVAVITRPHGLKGDVALELRTDSPQERFIAGAAFQTSDGRQLTLRRGWQHSGRWLVAFREVADR
ncbi:MAG TPA: ribosome maturation factor RimM, partial [Actinomycetales bacterium]|nr:ribosome maturation factor RimM [Actinomycetales bacterium]